MRITRADLQAGKTYSYSELRESFDPCQCTEGEDLKGARICYWHRRLYQISQEGLWVFQEEIWSDVVGFYLDWHARRRKYLSKAHAFDIVAPEDIPVERPNHDYMYALHYGRYWAARRILITS